MHFEGTQKESRQSATAFEAYYSSQAPNSSMPVLAAVHRVADQFARLIELSYELLKIHGEQRNTPNNTLPAQPRTSNERRKLADEIDCFLEEDICELGNIKTSTLKYWRQHKRGPKSILFGNTHLYPKPAFIDFVMSGAAEADEDFIRKVIKK